MSTRPVIFISSVSKELHTTRDLVAKTLFSMGYEPKWEDIARSDTGGMRGVLRKWVDDSDAVLQLVGHCYGLAPKDPDPHFGPCSYTQYVALYAREQRKKVWYVILSPEHPTDPCAAEASDMRELQDAYREKVTATSDLYYPSASLRQTENIVLKLRDDLAELGREAKAREGRLQQEIHSTQQTVTDLGHNIMVGINGLKQEAKRLPKLPFFPDLWPQASPFHNRGFPDQKSFVGQAALLRAMKEALDAGRNVAVTQPVAIYGAGGMGKTRAAVEFVRANGSSYTLRLFLNAQSPEALRASLADVARKLELTGDPQASADTLVLLALRLLRAVPTALVVADNADTPSALADVRVLCHEPGGVRWIVTTRFAELGEDFAKQTVGLLTEAQAVKLLQQRGSKNGHHPGSDEDARTVAIELGLLPLALQQAGAYVAHQHLTWVAYRTLLAANPAQALSRDAVEMKDVPDSILRTYGISLYQLTPTARKLLEVAVRLPPAPIVESFFLHDDDGSRRAALVQLANLSLIEWQGGLLEVPRTIAIAVRNGLDRDEERQTVAQVINGRNQDFSREGDERHTALRVDDYASAFAQFFTSAGTEECCLAIYAPWGRGKSFLMKRVKVKLAGIGYETVVFQAWRYPTRPEVWVHLYETMSRTAFACPWWQKWPRIFRTGVARHGFGSLICALLSLGFALYPKIHMAVQVAEYIKATVVAIGIGSAVWLVNFFFSSTKSVKKLSKTYLSAPSHNEKLGLQATIGDDLAALLDGWMPSERWPGWFPMIGFALAIWLIFEGAAQWGSFIPLGWLAGSWGMGAMLPWLIAGLVIGSGAWLLSWFGEPKRILLVVDDLDRCSFDHLISVMESVKLLIEDKKVSRRLQVAMLVEEEVLKHAILHKYTAVRAAEAGGMTDDRIIRESCEKLFTVHLRLEPLSADDAEEVLARMFSASKAPASEIADVAKDVGVDDGVDTRSDGSKNDMSNADDVLLNSEADEHNEPRAQNVREEVLPDVVQQVELPVNQQLLPCFSPIEEGVLIAAIRELVEVRANDVVGPRSVRNFVFRYQLARLLLNQLEVPFEPLSLAQALVIAMTNRQVGGLNEQILRVVKQIS